MTPAKLAFGVEFEMLLKPRRALVSQLNEIYRVEGLANIAPVSTDWATGLEIVKQAQLDAEDSEVAKYNAKAYRDAFRGLAISSNEQWETEIEKLFKALNRYYYIKLTTGCSMHIHVSPAANPNADNELWSTQELAAVMKALSYYDEAITKIMPADRKENPYALSNMNEIIAPDLNALYRNVEETSWKPLFDHYSKALRSRILKSRAFLIMGAKRGASWNFEHITDPCGTVEFRRCPGVDNSEDAKHWINFTLGFIYQAAKANFDWNTVAGQREHPSVADLSAFVEQGIQGLESTCRALGRIVENNDRPSVYTAEETSKRIQRAERRTSQYSDTVPRVVKATIGIALLVSRIVLDAIAPLGKADR
ncbi:hypothetical protein VP1G_10340 [Cytospora mali]|nr:hypothetical protein VP1G_10340 [Valsa mali var. pyri (nom. inval.)]